MADHATSYANTFITNLLNRTTDRTTPNNTSSAIRRISWAGDTLQDIETVNDGAHRCVVQGGCVNADALRSVVYDGREDAEVVFQLKSRGTWDLLEAWE